MIESPLPFHHLRSKDESFAVAPLSLSLIKKNTSTIKLVF